MRIFGKKVFTRRPLTLEEQEKRQAQERLQNIRNLREERKHLAKTDQEYGKKAYEADKERRAVEAKMDKAAGEARLARIEADREVYTTQARMAKRKRSATAGIAGGLVSMVKKAKKPRTTSGRTVYVKTARGYKPTYIETPVSSTPAAKSQEVKKDDWWDVPPAFRGL